MSLADREVDTLRHPSQRMMSRRIETLLSIIRDSGAEGIEGARLEETFFMNGLGEPNLVKKYLRYLVGFGKVVPKGSRYTAADSEKDAGGTHQG